MGLIDLLPGDTPLKPVPAGELIFAQGDPGEVMYVVADGHADILIGGRPVETIGPGGVVGEMALIDAQPRSATVIARSDCTLIPVDERRFNMLVSKRPEFALQVMRVLALRLRRMDAER
jgi:CRP-like cAMP-binding protein